MGLEIFSQPGSLLGIFQEAGAKCRGVVLPRNIDARMSFRVGHELFRSITDQYLDYTDIRLDDHTIFKQSLSLTMPSKAEGYSSLQGSRKTL